MGRVLSSVDQKESSHSHIAKERNSSTPGLKLHKVN